MTAEEVIAHLKPKPARRAGTGTAAAYQVRPLLRLESLSVYHAMRQFRHFPGIQVAPPLGEWPDWLKEDIDNLMLAEHEAERQVKTDSQQVATMDAAEAAVTARFHAQFQDKGQ